MTTSTEHDVRETIGWLHPQLISVLLRFDKSKPEQPQLAVWGPASMVAAKQQGIVTYADELSVYGYLVINELHAEESKFAALNNLLSGEAREWLLHPVAAVNEVVKVELNVSDLRDVETGARTGYGTRFLWYLNRQSV